LDPTLEHYQHFAMTSDVLVIGVPQGVIGPNSCGNQEAIIAWPNLQEFLNDRGRELVGSLRSP
jgi:hypothetical protein